MFAIRLSAASRLLTCMLFMVATSAHGFVTTHAEPSKLHDRSLLVLACIGDDAVARHQAISRLRRVGQSGVDALCEAHDLVAKSSPGMLCSLPGTVPFEATPVILTRLRHAIDAVAQQRDAFASRLFWHTDFADAQAASRLTDRPILSLRLLGKLDEDLSCANSRFFRSALYANRKVADYLRGHFILHWHSVRPVPKLTIDFGDGRRIERTITGNSIHYVLSSDGAIIDALPGLYAPAEFLRHLQAAETILMQSQMVADAAARADLLCTWHAAAVVRIDRQLNDDLQRIQLARSTPPLTTNADSRIRPVPLVIPAAAIAVSKMRAEFTAVEAAIDAPGAIADASVQHGQPMWEALAALHAQNTMFDESSVSLMLSKLPADDAYTAQTVTESKRMVETPAMRVLREFGRSIAIDSVRNEYELHRTIHGWLAEPHSESALRLDVEAFNTRVYAELFLTPLDDPWMGLAPHDAYAAIDQSGLIHNEPTDVSQ